MRRLIGYRCTICGCKFSIDKEYIKHAEEERRYIACPLNSEHKRNNIINEDIKKLMEERSAVSL